MSQYDYDLLVIGSGPAGHRAAIQAAKLDKRVAIIEKRTVLGGVCINTGTIPSKTLREAALRLSGYRERGIYGASYSVKQHITMRDLLFRVDHVISNEIDVARHQLMRNGVDILTAQAVVRRSAPAPARAGAGRHRARRPAPRHRHRRRHDDGARPIRPLRWSAHLHVRRPVERRAPAALAGGRRRRRHRPRVRVHLRGARRPRDDHRHARPAAAVRRPRDHGRARLSPAREPGDAVSSARPCRPSSPTMTITATTSASISPAASRSSPTRCCTASAGAARPTSWASSAAGLRADDRGGSGSTSTIRRTCPHIYAVGDVIGFPSLASTSMEQGRLAAATRSAWRPTAFRTCFPTASTRCPASRWSARPRSS